MNILASGLLNALSMCLSQGAYLAGAPEMYPLLEHVGDTSFMTLEEQYAFAIELFWDPASQA